MTALAEILSYILYLILAALAFLLGIKTNCFDVVADPNHSFVASSFLSLIVFICGERITNALRDHNVKSELATQVEAGFSSIPEVANILEFTSGDHAMQYLASRVEYASVILNTKISRDGISPGSSIADNYNKKLTASIKRGLTCKDIVSSRFLDEAKAYEKMASKGDGNYQYAEMKEQPPCFLNFIIVEYQTGDEELILGWATSAYMGTEKHAYKIRDKRVIRYFKEYHAALFNG